MNNIFISIQWCIAVVLIMSNIGCSATPQQASIAGLDTSSGVVGSLSQARANPANENPQLSTDNQPKTGVRTNPDTSLVDAQIRLKVAENAYARGNWPLAIKEFKYLTSIYTRNTQVWFALGSASALVGSYEDAATAFETVVRIDPLDVRASYNLGLIRISQAEIALASAQTNSANASTELKQEILRLSTDLAPAFNRPVADKNSALDKPLQTKPSPAGLIAPVSKR